MRTAILALAMLIGAAATATPVLAQSMDQQLAIKCLHKNAGDHVWINGGPIPMRCPAK
jgi:hypothetical protein